MQRYSITRSLNLPEFKIEKIIKENPRMDVIIKVDTSNV